MKRTVPLSILALKMLALAALVGRVAATGRADDKKADVTGTWKWVLSVLLAGLIAMTCLCPGSAALLADGAHQATPVSCRSAALTISSSGVQKPSAPFAGTGSGRAMTSSSSQW